MEGLATFALLKMPTAPQFADAKAVDRHYQAMDIGNPRPFLFPLVSMAAVFGLVVLIGDWGSL